MAAEEITNGLVGRDRYDLGQRVCVLGRGTAATLHRHGRVDRFTRTLMIVKTDNGGGERRYRLGGDGLEIGHGSGYGGTYVAPRCQRPKS